MKDFVSMYKHDKHYDVEARAFHTIAELLSKAIKAPTPQEGRGILQYIEDWKILDAFDDKYRTRERMRATLDDHWTYLTPETTDQIERLKYLCAQYGLVVEETAGNGRKRDLVTCTYDGVPYSLALWDGRGGIDPSKIRHSAMHYALMVNRHHKEIKAVYDHLISNHGAELGDVWVMTGGGGQLQAFFGNRTGYLGILYLTLEDLEDQERLTENGYLAACGNESFTLTANWAKNNKYFKGMTVPGVELQGDND
jgi:hypothetical protein